MRIKHLRQALADKKAEGQAILDAAGNRRLTDDEKAKFDAVAAEVASITEDITREEAWMDQQRSGAAASAPVVEFGTDRASLRPWGPQVAENAPAEQRLEARRAALGEFAIAVRGAMTGTGYDPRLSAAATGMGTSNGADGGFAVPQEIASGIEREMYATGELLSRVDARTISGDSIAYTVVDETSRVDGQRQSGVLGYWVDQGTAPTATQMKLARVEMKLRKVGALGYMTDELVADAAALGGELQASFVEELQFQTENAIFRGTGAGQPLGFTAAPCLVSVAKEGGQAADTINATNLVKMWARMPARSKSNAVWLVNSDCFPQLNALVFPTGATEVAARFIGYGPTGMLTAFGRPVVEIEYAATLGDVNDITLVDLSKYRLIRKGGVEQASSIHVRFTQGEQTFRAFYRVDGQPVPRSAITPFRGSATQSPFVALAERA